MATSVISANEAMHYLQEIIPQINVLLSTVFLLSLFAGLTIIGITESSHVAIGIFIFHLSSMIVLSVTIALFLFNNGIETFITN